MTCCTYRVDGAPPSGGGAAAGSIFFAEHEVDFSADANQIIPTGSVTIDGQTWTGQAVAGQTFRVQNGLGLVYDVNGSATNTQFSTTLSTAAYIFLPMSTVRSILGVDVTATVEVAAYATTDTSATSSYWCCGLWGRAGRPINAVNRIITSMRQLSGGVQLFKSRTSAGDSNNYQYTPTPNVVGVIKRATDVGSIVGGTWSGTWPTWAYHASGGNPVTASASDWSASEFVLAFATNSGAGVMSVTIERVRFRAWEFRV